ncbi:MAG TPA: hypothetical protein VL860_05595, partial [Planctomycetota bacterium]|nr:hypothetical protein [Planctomycetota bacterium]
KENPKLADQMIDQVRWLTGAGDAQGAVVELRTADAAVAQALQVPLGERVLQIELGRNNASTDIGANGADLRRLSYALRRIPMEEASTVPWNELDAANGGLGDPRASGEARWVSPGRFAVAWAPREAAAGVYALELTTPGSRSEADGVTAAQREVGRFTLAVPAGPEYLQTGVSREALQALATAGGGKLIDGADAASQWRWRVENQWRASLSNRIAREGRDLRLWVALFLILLVIVDSAVRWFKPKVGVGVAETAGADQAATVTVAEKTVDRVRA